jgi:protein O-mannosyl-transferase
VWGIFVHDFWGQDISMNTSHKSYRPLTTLLYPPPPPPPPAAWCRTNLARRFRGVHSIHGSHNASMLLYHASNLALHAAATSFSYITCASVARLSSASSVEAAPGSFLLPFIAAALFATHPVHTEAVANIVRAKPPPRPHPSPPSRRAS